MSTLLLRLAGPMQSWGTVARFREAATELEPTLSGVVGLLAACQGRPRSADLSDLAELRMGVRVDRPGRVEVDYQTAGGGNAPGEAERWGVRSAANPRARQTVQSWRAYLADSEFLVGLEGDAALLDALAAAARAPVFAPFLGRKSFPPARALLEGVVPEGLEEALRQGRWLARSRAELAGAAEGVALRLVLPAPPGPGSRVRPERPLSLTWQDRRFAPHFTRVETMHLAAERVVADPLQMPEEA